MEELQIKRDVAEEIIKRSDHHRRNFMRFAYHEEWLDPKLYDIILNTDKLSVESAVHTIIQAATSDEIKVCGIDSVRQLERLSLQWEVESVLVEKGISNQVFVSVEDVDTVRLNGLVASAEEKKAAERWVREIGEIKTVKNNLQVHQRVGE
jgi:hypothetical protein